jgi:hypothetical protein
MNVKKSYFSFTPIIKGYKLTIILLNWDMTGIISVLVVVNNPSFLDVILFHLLFADRGLGSRDLNTSNGLICHNELDIAKGSELWNLSIL